jgi:hypothetical protein
MRSTNASLLPAPAIVFLVFAAARPVCARDSDVVLFLNQYLGQQESQLIAEWGPPTPLHPSGDGTSSNVPWAKGLATDGTEIRSLSWEITAARFLEGTPATSNTVSRGRIDANGNWRGTSQTTITPSQDSQTAHLLVRLVYFFDSAGKATSWEKWAALDLHRLACSTCSDDPSLRRPGSWLLADSRVMEIQKNGKTKIFKPKRDYRPMVAL